MYTLGKALADWAGGFASLDADLNRDRLGIYVQSIKAHSGEVKQDREGYHIFTHIFI
jgi:hypothetical protein